MGVCRLRRLLPSGRVRASSGSFRFQEELSIMGGGADFSLLGMWKSMGIPARMVVIVLAIMSIYSLSVMAERLFSFARAKEQSRRYAEKLRDLLPGHQLVEAANVANSLKYGHIPRVLGSGIAEYNGGRVARSHQ